jgi:hypothetical protein
VKKVASKNRTKKSAKRQPARTPSSRHNERPRAPPGQDKDDELDCIPSRDEGDANFVVERRQLRQQVQAILDDVRAELRNESKALLEREVSRQAQLDVGEARALEARRESDKALRDVIEA